MATLKDLLDAQYGTEKIQLSCGVEVEISNKKKTVQDEIDISSQRPDLATNRNSQMEAGLHLLLKAIVSRSVEDEITIENLKILPSVDIQMLVEKVNGTEEKKTQ